jgi:hypothetical protein
MLPLLSRTPGLTAYVPVTPGAAVEVGFRHPIALEACPVFHDSGLVLFRGRGEPALELDRLPALGDARALGRAALSELVPRTGAGRDGSPNLGVRLALEPDTSPPTTAGAILVPPDELPLLRRLAYLLGAETIRSTKIAITEHGAFVMRDEGVEALPVGTFFRRIHPSVFIPSGWRVVPRVSPEVVFQALGSPGDRAVFFWTNGAAAALPLSGFVPLEAALVEGHAWAPLGAMALENPFAEQVPTVWLDALGIHPLKGVGSA